MINDILSSLQFISDQTLANANLLAKILAVLWITYIINIFFNQRLFILGIFPRKIYGLMGILFAPILHANFNHLFFNSIPLVVLSNFLLITGFNYFLSVTLIITLISGGLVWCFARPGIHIGASALVTGYWGLLISDILNQGTTTAIILGFISLYYFAGIFLGIFPNKQGVSWEGHLFGLIAGIITSYASVLQVIKITGF